MRHDVVFNQLKGSHERDGLLPIFDEEVGNGLGASAEICVLLDQDEDTFDHGALRLLVGLAGVVGVVLAQVGVHPHLHFPVFVDTDQFFCGLEITDDVVELLEAQEAVAEDVDILWVGDVSDVAQPDRDVLDVYVRTVGVGAEIFG